MSPPLFLQSELRSNLSPPEEHLIPLDLRDISKTMRDVLPIPLRPARIFVPLDATKGPSLDSCPPKRQKVAGIGMVEPLSPVFTDDGDPLSMKYIDEIGA
jgi:hypothetical protein